MDRFIDKVKQETHGELLGDLEIVRIPLNLYRARNATSRQWRTAGPGDHPFASSPVFLLGDSAIGSPYFQSISLGFECAMFLAGLIAQRDLPLRDMLDRYELLHVQAVASRVHAQQDDQAQQGSVRDRRRQVRDCSKSSTSTRWSAGGRAAGSTGSPASPGLSTKSLSESTGAPASDDREMVDVV